jgi:glycine/D-amino acid oxidase-like deaminating enzyme
MPGPRGKHSGVRCARRRACGRCSAAPIRCARSGTVSGGAHCQRAGQWLGYVTPDRSVYVAVMHSALTLAPTVGRLVADELVGDAPVAELRRCRPQRFAAL